MAALEDHELTDEDREFVDRLYREHGGRLWSYCSRLVGLDGAGDVVHEVFYELIRKPERIADLRVLDADRRRGWLFLAAYRKALRQLERWNRAMPTDRIVEGADARDPMDRWLGAAHAETLMAQVRQTFDERDQALLRVSLDISEEVISYEQAAVELAMKVDAVRQAVNRMVNPEKGYLRGAVLTVYLHDTGGGKCTDDRLRRAVSGELTIQLRTKVVRHGSLRGLPDHTGSAAASGRGAARCLADAVVAAAGCACAGDAGGGLPDRRGYGGPWQLWH
ncbi:RNA polymerase sigma factor [Catenulispora yoronensis]